MKLVMIGVNHASLNMDERETFYFRESDKLAFSTRLLDENIDQTLILSTCNRSEVYVICDYSFDENRLKEAFLSYFHQNNTQVEMRSGTEAIEYLLEVACGLQSMVIGEDQILHQIREALNWTMEQKFAGKELNYLFQNTIRFARSMRKKYAISEHPLSVSYIGYQRLLPYLNPSLKIMVCGIGEMARLMLEYLKGYQLLLVNRTYEKVVPYLNENRTFIPFEKRYEHVGEVDIIISATSSPHIVFDSEKIETSRPLLFLDLAMPRDVDLKLKQRPNTLVIDMDDLKKASELEKEKRLEICQWIKAECEKEKDQLAFGLQSMKSDTVIAKMQARYLDISEETYELLLRKLNLSSKEAYILKKVLKTSFLRLMKEPIQLLKSQDVHLQEQYIELVSAMMKLEEEK